MIEGRGRGNTHAFPAKGEKATATKKRWMYMGRSMPLAFLFRSSFPSETGRRWFYLCLRVVALKGGHGHGNKGSWGRCYLKKEGLN